MPPPYVNPHWTVFANTPYRPQEAVGMPPASWASRYGLSGVPNMASLPTNRLNRNQVRAICTDPSNKVLFGYVCAMAWGGQGNNGKTPLNVTLPWAANKDVADRLTALRAGGLTRDVAYGTFLGAGAISHLGPSFFTKLLYFFTPLPNFYIMDSQVAKAVCLLTGTWMVRMNGATHNLLAPSNKTGNYRAFCEEIDLIAGQLACTGQQAEERLFSRGGMRPWPWRTHVTANWPLFLAAVHYNYKPSLLHAVYPHIPIADL
jgi:hypothetical protein